jgi:hypothetical protein
VYKESNTKALMLIFGILIVIVCGVLLACLIPFGLFAWIADRQMDWFEEQSPPMQAVRAYLGW